MSADLRQIVEALLLVYAALLPIVNPLGAAPVFLAMTAGSTREQRASLAQRVAVNAFILLLASLSIGTYVLDFFGLSLPVVQVGGGLVVCAVAWTLLRQEDPATRSARDGASAKHSASRAFYPLTLPLTVGPGAMTVAITLGANHPSGVRSFLTTGIGHLIGVTLMAATVFVCYRYADRLMRALGETGANVVLRLSAFILVCIGVQIVWNGASALLSTVIYPPGR
jgi:multiple antibiotic resistance protein